MGSLNIIASTFPSSSHVFICSLASFFCFFFFFLNKIPYPRVLRRSQYIVPECFHSSSPPSPIQLRKLPLALRLYFLCPPGKPLWLNTWKSTLLNSSIRSSGTPSSGNINWLTGNGKTNSLQEPTVKRLSNGHFLTTHENLSKNNSVRWRRRRR